MKCLFLIVALMVGGASHAAAQFVNGTALNASGMALNASNATLPDARTNLGLASISIMDYGAIPDGKGFTDAGVTSISGSATVTFTTASFTSADVGKAIFVAGIGAAAANFTGTIAAVNGANSINLNATAGTSVSAVSKEVAWGTDNLAAINSTTAAARAAIATGDLTSGANLICPQGSYYVSGPLNFTGLSLRQGSKPVTINGDGCTIIGTAVNGVVVDALGTAATQFRGFSVYAGLNGGNASIGLQVGRYGLATSNDAGAQTVYNSLDNLHVFGWFSQAALHDFAAEDLKCTNSNFYNSKSTAGSHAATLDGINHFNTQSTFQTQANAVDVAVSFDDTVLDNCHFQNVGPSAVVWLANPRHIEFQSGFIQSQGTDGIGVALYAGVGNILDARFNTHMEQSAKLKHNFLITGTSASPTIIGLRYHDASNQAITSVIALDTGVTSAKLPNLDIHISSIVNTPTVFDTPSAYSVYGGKIFVPIAAATMWPTNPAIFNGTFCAGSTTSCATVLQNAGTPPSGMRGTIYYNSTSQCFNGLTDEGAACLAIDRRTVSGVGWTNTGIGTTEINLVNVAYPALGTNTAIRINTLWDSAGSVVTNTKSMSIRLGTAACTPGATCTDGSQVMATAHTTSAMISQNTTTVVHNLNATNAQAFFNTGNANGVGVSNAAPVTAAVETNAGGFLHFNCATATASTDSCKLVAYTIELVSGG